MKGLIYPLLAIVALILLTLAASAVVVAINSGRERRALRRARWEPFVAITGSGQAEIGVQLIAHWGRHHHVLQREEHTERVHPEDVMARIEARSRAELRAQAYNALIANGERE